MSENLRWFGAVTGAGIVNGNSEFFSFLLVLRVISMLHTPISSVCMTCSFMTFLHSLNKEHSLGTHECQANGMLVLPIYFLHIKWPNMMWRHYIPHEFQLVCKWSIGHLRHQSAMQHIEIYHFTAKFKVKCVCRGLCSGVAEVHMMADSEGQSLPIRIIYISPLMKQKVPQLPGTHTLLDTWSETLIQTQLLCEYH